MAKSQMRSNKEVKKPKKDKVKAKATASSGTTARITESQDRAKGKSKE